MRFQDKVAIVTGGNSGMGKEVARRFVTEGGLVVVNGRNAAKTETAVKEIDSSGKRAIAYVGDIALPATGDAVVKAALGRFGRLDVLFNNAGIFAPKPFLEVDEAEYDRFVDNILKGSFFAAQAAAKAMKAAGHQVRLVPARHGEEAVSKVVTDDSVVFLAVPDGAVSDYSAALARSSMPQGVSVVHVSGALGLSALAP